MPVPLAERMRPKTFDELLGQVHLSGEKSTLRRALSGGNVPSMILWGPPGVGKTTLAQIIVQGSGIPFYTLSAISAGVKDVREVIERAKTDGKAILFIDEIHRFNKGQQDALLGAVEKGTITLIGATTENPSFEVNSALLSRSQVYVLRPLTDEEMVQLLKNALAGDELLKERNIELKENGSSAQSCRWRCPPAAQPAGTGSIITTFGAGSHHRWAGDGRGPAESGAVRQERGAALRRDFRFHQIHSRE